MHIPDGFIDGKTVAATAALSAIGVGLALNRVRRTLPARKVPMLGLAAAFLFAAQMLNFPVVAGTSGHLMGGVLVASLLGPSAAVVVVTTVLIVQCFLFQDGGVLALGANVFNMGILGAGGGCVIYRCVSALAPGPRGRVAAVAFAAWLSTVLAAAACAAQIAWSGKVDWKSAFTAMAGVHVLIGIGEGLISALVFAAVQRTRPELIQDGANGEHGSRWGEFAFFGLLGTIGLAVFIRRWRVHGRTGSSPWPRSSGSRMAASPAWPALAPDYAFPGIHSAALATAAAGALGCLIVFALALLLARFLVPRKTPNPPLSTGQPWSFTCSSTATAGRARLFIARPLNSSSGRG